MNLYHGNGSYLLMLLPFKTKTSLMTRQQREMEFKSEIEVDNKPNVEEVH